MGRVDKGSMGMVSEGAFQGSQDSFVEALRSESIAGTENVSTWVKHIQAQQGIETLFELETWLRGLRSYFDVRHVPLSEAEREGLLGRDFAPEIRVVRSAFECCERCASELVRYRPSGQLEFESFVEIQMRKDSILDYHVSRILEQPTPTESLLRLLESLNDLRVLISSLGAEKQNFQLFLTIGRSYRRDLKACRYIDMLLTQRFRVEYDRMQTPALSGILRTIAEEKIRRDVTLALLYLYRLLRYLKVIARDLARDGPLRHSLVVFSLVHDEMGRLSDFLKSRFLKGSDIGHGVRNSAELVVYSLGMESQRALELIGVAAAPDIPAVYTRIENSHGLLCNCFQSCIITLLQAFDREFDGKAIFPSMMDNLQEAQKLKRDLWDLRQFVRDVLERRDELDSHRIVDRVTEFRESTLRYLMYQDWGEFERFSDALITANDRTEVRTLLRKFVTFLETLIQEVSKRSAFQPSESDDDLA